LTRAAISPAEAEAARNEIKRKMLSVAPAAKIGNDPMPAARALRLALGGGIPALALGLYALVGRPDLPGSTFDPSAGKNSAQSQPASLPDVETLAARLAERLEKNPDDAQGWGMLGWAYASLDRHAESIKAYERAAALDPKNAALLSLYGEAVVRAAGGEVTPEAETIFDRALALNPADPRAQFFRGLALEQRNKPREALAQWVKIIREGKADDAWLPALRARAVELAIKLKLDPAKTVPGAQAPTRAPTADDVAAASKLSPAEQNRMILGMVQGLEERLQRNPNDLEGWLMLARSRNVLGDANAARVAIGRARVIFGADKQSAARIAEVESQIGLK
jgi:cytochrome c-type biogenesis protein CcmH